MENEKKVWKQNIFLKKLVKLYPIILLVIVVPLIVYLKPVKLTGISLETWIGEENNYDFFSYYKSKSILLFSLLSFISFYFVKKYKKSIFYIPLLVYSFFLILSTLLAEHKSVAIWGFVDRYEGMLVLLAYTGLVVLLINLIEDELDIKLILGSILFGSFAISLIGILQFFNMDLFKTKIGKLWILPEKFEYGVDKLNFSFLPGTIYSTLYNTNYVGSYMAMVLIISIGLIFVIKNKKIQLLMIILNLLIFSNWIGCRSRAGMVGGMAGLILFLMLFRKIVIKKRILFLNLIVGYSVIALFMNLYTIKSETANAGSLFGKIASFSKEVEGIKSGIEVKLKDIKLGNDYIEIITQDKEGIKIEIKDSVLTIYDFNGEKLRYSYFDENGMKKIKIEDEKYKNYDIKIDKNRRFDISFYGINLQVAYSGDSFKIITLKGLDNIHNDIERVKYFDGKEKVGSMRFYIWSRSIPLLKRTLFWGFGPDTFAIYFPQNDYIGKLKSFGNIYTVVDKPHNLYLQIGINTGLLSLIVFCILSFGYVIYSVRLYIFEELSNFGEVAGAIICVSVFSYLVSGMFNDSIVSVATIFWILLGSGIGVNVINGKWREKI